MPRSRPQLSITLPRNFTFHYTEGEEEPKTPEQNVSVPILASPQAEGPYRIKRRSRPAAALLSQPRAAAASVLSDHGQPNTIIQNDVPFPSIEVPNLIRPSRPLFQQTVTEPVKQNLVPPFNHKFRTVPRTPEPQQRPFINQWNNQHDLGESIIRPLSTCSIMSDSSDESGSLTSYPTADGSCTSPESDAPDPFKFSSVKRSKGKSLATFTRSHEHIQSGVSKQGHPNWTPDMDRHLWSTYLMYLQDPTVTPFKMLPGIAPPLGVCHRVAREARKSWKSKKPSSLLSPSAIQDGALIWSSTRPGSPDTIRATRSGSNTPTDVSIPKLNVWPKSGSSTRRRLRFLCKRKFTIAPHYQRLLQSRSPSPFSSSTYLLSRPQSRLSEVSSPVGLPKSPFSTRDVQLSLTTSTSDTMQPDGPLAQLAASERLKQEWFNEPPAPFASEVEIPSDVITEEDSSAQEDLAKRVESRHLASPFAFHTWGPSSRSKQHLRPCATRMQSSDAATIGPGPSLRSPLRMLEKSPYPGIYKRRARHQLDDELSPGGSNVQQDLLNDTFGNLAEGRHRRVRSRGFSLGDVNSHNPLNSLFNPPDPIHSLMRSDGNAVSTESRSEPKTPKNPIRHLESPFHGVSPRPTRRTPRHTATTSLGAYGSSMFFSIGETLGNAPSSVKPNHE